jgi:hypothetical protein
MYTIMKPVIVAVSGPGFSVAAPHISAQRYVYQLDWTIFLSVSNFIQIIGCRVLPYQNI